MHKPVASSGAGGVSGESSIIVNGALHRRHVSGTAGDHWAAAVYQLLCADMMSIGGWQESRDAGAAEQRRAASDIAISPIVSGASWSVAAVFGARSVCGRQLVLRHEQDACWQHRLQHSTSTIVAQRARCVGDGWAAACREQIGRPMRCSDRLHRLR